MDTFTVYLACPDEHDGSCPKATTTRAQRRKIRRELEFHPEARLNLVVVHKADNPNPRAA